MATTDISISLANSIRFVNQNGLLPSFDNTLSYNESFHNAGIKFYEQRFKTGETVLVQIKAGKDATVVLTKYKDGSTPETITLHDTTAYTDFDILDYLILLESEECFTLVATSETSTFESEPINVESDLTGLVKFQWFNFDAAGANSNFEFDYSTTDSQNYVNFAYVDGELLEYAPTGESTVFDNQNEVIKVKETLFRQLTFKSTEVPRYLAEKIVIALAHDKCLINDVEFVAKELPKIDLSGRTNLVNVTAELTQRNVLGLNTYDIGFDVDSIIPSDMVKNKKAATATVSGQFTIDAGFSINMIVAKANSGTPTLKIGTTIGGDNIMKQRSLTSTPYIANLNFTPDTVNSWIVYYTIGGGSPSVYLSINTVDTNTAI